MWQDWVITGAQVIFILALIPAIVSSSAKPPLLTSVPTVAGLISTTVAFTTLELWFSALAAGLLTLFWAILAFQKWRQET